MARQELLHFSRAKIFVTESRVHYTKRQHPEMVSPPFLPREDSQVEVMYFTLPPALPGGPAPFPTGVQRTPLLRPSHRPPPPRPPRPAPIRKPCVQPVPPATPAPPPRLGTAASSQSASPVALPPGEETEPPATWRERPEGNTFCFLFLFF